MWWENISLALSPAKAIPQGYGDLPATWCLRGWSTLAFGHWRSLVGNQTADKKKPNQPLPIHQLPLPWLQLWFVANLPKIPWLWRGTPACSVPPCVYWEHLAHIAVNLAFVTSVCSVSLGPAVVAKCSSVQEIWPQPPQPTAQHWLTTSLSLALA